MGIGGERILSHLNMAKGMKIVQLGMEFKGITPPKYKLGAHLKELSQYQVKHGAITRVYLPASGDIEKNLKRVDEKEIKVSAYDERKVKISRVELPQDANDPIDNLSVFLVEDEVIFGSYDIYYHKEWVYPWVIFPLAVLEHLKQTEFHPDVIQCHEWQTGLLPMYLKIQSDVNSDPFVRSIRSVFTSHDYKNIGLFHEGQWKLMGLPGDLFTHKALEYYKTISLLKAGMHAADMVVYHSEEDMRDAINNDTPAGMPGFIKELLAKGKVMGILPKRTAIYDSMPSSYGRGMIEIYRALLCKGKYSLDLYLALMKEIENRNFMVEGIFRNIRKWEPDDHNILRLFETRNTSNAIYASAGSVDILGEDPKTRHASGSGIIGILSDKLDSISANGKYVLPLDAGENRRTWGIGLATARIKGLIKILGRKLSEQVVNQSISVFSQLPKRGLGWILPFASDNIMSTERIMVGRRPLHETSFGLILFAQPENVDKNINLPEMKKLEEFGILTVNEETGEITSFLEKPKIEVIISKTKSSNSSLCYKNAFLMAIRHDIAVMMARMYNQKSNANDGMTMLERGIDWSRHIIEPMLLSRDDWMKSPEEGGSGWGANAKDMKVAKEDWERLWEIACQIKEASGGVGVGSLGIGSWWSDTSNAYEVHHTNFLATSNDMEVNRRTRELFGVPTNIDVINSAEKDVVLPASAGNYLIMRSVFKKGGKVGKNCVIIDSVFEDYIEIPDQTVIIGSHIYQVDNAGYLTECGSLIYNLNTDGAVFKFSKMTAQMSIYLRDGKKINGIHPVDVEPYADSFNGKKDVDGRAIFDGRSFDELQGEVSLEKTLQVQEALQLEIMALLKQIEGSGKGLG